MAETLGQLKNDPDILRGYVEQIEAAQQRRAAADEDIARSYREAANAGFDKKVLKRLVAKRAGDTAAMSEEDQLLATYEANIARSLG